MKKLLLLLFSLMLSFNSYGVWVSMGDSNNKTHYLEVDTIKENNSYLYSWDMQDYFEPRDTGMVSSKMYRKIDCEVYRYKILTFISYNESMGKGEADDPYTPPDEWAYPATDTFPYVLIQAVCWTHENM